jgi:hypothetical protein
MKIDLSLYVNGKEVTVTHEDGSVKNGFIRGNNYPNYPYSFDGDIYTRDGFVYADKRLHPINIKSIKLKEVPMTLEEEIQKTQEQLEILQNKLKERSNKTYKTGDIGDVINNTIIVDKGVDWVLIAKKCDKRYYYIDDIDNDTKMSGWFLPDADMLRKLYKVNNEWASHQYWVRGYDFCIPSKHLVYEGDKYTSKLLIKFCLLSI